MKELSRFKHFCKSHSLFLPPHCQIHWSISGRGAGRGRGIWNKVSSPTALPTSRISLTELQYLTITESLNLQTLHIFIFPPPDHFIPSLLPLIEVGFKKKPKNSYYAAVEDSRCSDQHITQSKVCINLVTLEMSSQNKVGDTDRPAFPKWQHPLYSKICNSHN